MSTGSVFIWMILGLAMLPMIQASSVGSPFPSIPFKTFSQFITQNFSSKITLSAVLMVLFSLSENPDLLNLHARQQYVKCQGEHRTQASGWIKGLAWAIKKQAKQPLKMKNVNKEMSEEEETTALGLKLDSLAKLLDLHPYDENGRFQGKLQPISDELIRPAHIICPDAMECQTLECKSRSLLQNTPTRDVPHVTLICNNVVYGNVPVLTGQCSTCKTKYMADHERAVENQVERRFSRLYLNSAKYLKIGQALWVDRLFSRGVLNGIYDFHASAAAYTAYWNHTFGKNQLVLSQKVTRCQVWQAFVQESIHSIAALSEVDLVLQDGLAIDEVTKEAFAILGANGIIRVAGGHTCSECTHEYKSTADVIPGSDPLATAGFDDRVPQGPIAVGDVQHAQTPSDSSVGDDDMQVDKGVVQLVVLDGIVTGPSVCCKDSCLTKF
jgi:hypothetical protein